jgi:hypothetical protein
MKTKNKKKMTASINEDRRVIWKDKKTLDIIIYLSLLIILFLLGSVVYFISKVFEKLFFGILLVALLIFFFLRLQRKFLLVTSKGMKLGNVTFKKFALSERKQNNLFLEWKNINKISLSKKAKVGPFGGLLFSYLTVTTKNNEKYECLLYNPLGFVQILKKLNKFSFLSKKSRYRNEDNLNNERN